MTGIEVQVGDTVRIGKGARVWRVQAFWTAPANGVTYASLGPPDAVGYSTTSALPDRLTIVTKAGAA